MKIKRVKLLGIPVDCVNMDTALDVVDSIISGNKAQTIIAVNPEKVIKAQDDLSFLEWLGKAGLLIPDGIGVVFGVRLLLGESIKRVPGSELMPAICARSEEKGYRLFLFGADPKVNEEAVHVLRKRYANINIVGYQHGFIDQSDMPILIERINSLQVDVLFVALGSPKQELWMEKYLPQLNIKVCQGVGGTFDVITGHVKRAPYIFRKAHLEWFYRLISQPKRLFRQTALPRFAFQVIRNKIQIILSKD